MSANDAIGLGTQEQRGLWRALDRDDVYALHWTRVFAFGVALFVMAMQLVFFFQQREMDPVLEANARLWAAGGIALGFVCGEVIRLKRRVIELEKRLLSTPSGAA